MNMVIASKKKNWLSGQAWKIVEELLEEYVPIDLMVDVNSRRSWKQSG